MRKIPVSKKRLPKIPHKVYLTADVEVKADRTEEEEEQAMRDFEEQMSKNLEE